MAKSEDPHPVEYVAKVAFHTSTNHIAEITGIATKLGEPVRVRINKTLLKAMKQALHHQKQEVFVSFEMTKKEPLLKIVSRLPRKRR